MLDVNINKTSAMFAHSECGHHYAVAHTKTPSRPATKSSLPTVIVASLVAIGVSFAISKLMPEVSLTEVFDYLKLILETLLK